jgi:hypothetical protein
VADPALRKAKRLAGHDPRHFKHLRAQYEVFCHVCTERDLPHYPNPLRKYVLRVKPYECNQRQYQRHLAVYLDSAYNALFQEKGN